MNTKSLLIAAVFLTLGSGAMGQNTTLDWWTVDGGAGGAQSATYALRGTLGQPDAGVCRGTTYTLHSGYWPGAIPQPPKLNIESLPDGSVKVSWPIWASDYVLKSSADVTAPRDGWDMVPPATYQTDGTCRSYILEPSPVGFRFYTLVKSCP